MINEARAWVQAAAVAAGVPAKNVFAAASGTTRHRKHPSVTMLPTVEQAQPVGQKVARFTDQAGKRMVRIERLKRDITLIVEMRHASVAELEATFLAVMVGLGQGFADATENHVRFTEADVLWEEDTSVSNKGAVATVQLRLTGGAFEDQQQMGVSSTTVNYEE